MITVIKRDKTKEGFSKTKIENAILSAYREVEIVGYKEMEEVSQIAQNIMDKYEEEGSVTIEEIQDSVETELMSTRENVAKHYILYREAKQIERRKGVTKNHSFPSELISKLKHQESKLTPLGSLVYSRTYSRYLPEYNRRETWLETCMRAVDYNTSITPTSELEKINLLENIYNLKQFLSGRTLWTGGTKISEEYPLSNFNCAFEVIENFEDFKEMFYLLMLGAGVGIRILPEDIAQLPKVRKVKLYHNTYTPKRKEDRCDYTSIVFGDNRDVTLYIGDSKEGWADAISWYFKLITEKQYKDIFQITMDYSNIRKKGERLVRMGGTASGPQALQQMFTSVNKMITSKPNDLIKLQGIDVLDIANHIGECVVSGGVRRTAEMIMIDPSDKDCINAKNDIYKLENGSYKTNTDLLHRQLSNNTIIFDDRPSMEELKVLIEKIRHTGEPGILNKKAALKRNPNFKGTNPCGEILLDSKQVCNLTTVNVLAFVQDGILDFYGLLQAQELSARAGFRMTLLELELPEWDKKQNRDRLLGCSLTGWQDMVNACNLDKAEERKVLRALKQVAHDAVEEYANELGVSVPELVTTVKPEGTLSQLPTVSSGVHYSHAPYYVRRVRVSATDPLIEVCKELEYPIFPEVGQTMEDAKTLVVEFPVKAPEGTTKKDITAIQQLENYLMFMEDYVDHNCSITVTVKDKEWEEVTDFIWNNWDEIVAVTLLPDSDSVYELLPYEEITEEEYAERKFKMRPFQAGLLRKYENAPAEEEILEVGCESGICPIR